MTGTPKSTGCSNCRRRKKKCGEERPHCRACISAGWICPGYTKRWKFVDENAQLSAHYRMKRYSYEKTDVDDDSTLDQILQYQPNGLRPYKASRIVYGVVWPRQSRPLVSELDRLASMLVYILNDSSGQTFCQIRSHANFIDYVPSRLGRNPALDSVTSSLCSLYVDTLTMKKTVKSLQLYGKSVSSLQACLKDPNRRMESETLCASILLQLCELLRSPGNSRWAYLSRGSKLLFESIGPQRCTISNFDRAMIESHRMWLTIQDLGSPQSCFLAQPQWREVFKLPMVTPVDMRNPRLSLRSELCDLLVDIPDLLSGVSRIANIEGNQTLGNIPAQHEKVLSRVIAQKNRIETWYATELEPLLWSSGDSRYPNVLIAVIDCVSSSALLTLTDASLTLTSIQLQHGLDCQLATYHYSSVTDYYKAAVRAALDFVSGISWIISEPLKDGLQQIWAVN